MVALIVERITSSLDHFRNKLLVCWPVPCSNISSEPFSFQLSLSYIGIYHEQIYDLLLPSIDFTARSDDNHLPLEENAELVIHIPGLTTVEVDCCETAKNAIHQAKQRLVMIDTAVMTAGSLTRDLTELLTLTLHHPTTSAAAAAAAAAGSITRSKLTIVNLQNSERVIYIGTFMAFSNIISALVNNNNAGYNDGKKLETVPYRYSKLTRLLQPTLSGQVSLTIIACCSCEDHDYRYIENTLKGVIRMKLIRGED